MRKESMRRANAREHAIFNFRHHRGLYVVLPVVRSSNWNDCWLVYYVVLRTYHLYCYRGVSDSMYYRYL